MISSYLIPCIVTTDDSWSFAASLTPSDMPDGQGIPGPSGMSDAVNEAAKDQESSSVAIQGPLLQ